jgi:hypothetical protein
MEKHAPEDVEHATRPGGLAANLSLERRAQVEKSLKRKLDARCSLFVLIYIMNYLDRNNIAAARLGGLQEDLGINNTQYATCLSILYVGYSAYIHNSTISMPTSSSSYIGLEEMCGEMIWQYLAFD